MATIHKYGIRDLKKDFPTDEKCVEFIFDASHSRKCSCGGSYKQLKGRRQFQCSKCRFQIAPTAGTIFYKSDTPLSLWFHAIYLFSNAKSGLSAKQLERDLNVTYKTAWRMLSLIRKSLKQDGDKLKGDVETDGAFFGGKGNAGENNKNLGRVMENKSVVLAVIERGGETRAEVAKSMGSFAIQDFIEKHVEKENTRLMTDKSQSYERVARGYDRLIVNHSIGEYVRGDVHVNSVETFWSHVKRSIKGTHKVISKKYLQSYLNGFVFHRNNRHNDRERFASLLGVLLLASK